MSGYPTSLHKQYFNIILDINKAIKIIYGTGKGSEFPSFTNRSTLKNAAALANRISTKATDDQRTHLVKDGVLGEAAIFG